MKKPIAALFACTFALIFAVTPALAQRAHAEKAAGFHFRFIGPRVGNRFSAFAGLECSVAAHS